MHDPQKIRELARRLRSRANSDQRLRLGQRKELRRQAANGEIAARVAQKRRVKFH
jgi:hypothetical protein